MGKICRNKNGEFVLFPDTANPEHLKRDEYYIENLLYSSIMVFDTLDEAQDMCNKVNEYENVYCLKNAWYD